MVVGSSGGSGGGGSARVMVLVVVLVTLQVHLQVKEIMVVLDLNSAPSYGGRRRWRFWCSWWQMAHATQQWRKWWCWYSFFNNRFFSYLRKRLVEAVVMVLTRRNWCWW
jgi:hypothetical protein